MRRLLLICILLTGCGTREAYLKGLEHGECVAAIEWRDYLKSQYGGQYVSGMGEACKGGITMDHIYSFRYHDYSERCEKIEEHLSKLKWKSGSQLLKENPLPKPTPTPKVYP